MESIQRAAVFLERHRSRDKVFRTLQYSATLWAGYLQPPHGTSSIIASKLISFSKAMSETRTILRLLDDLPVWARLLTMKTVRDHKNASSINLRRPAGN